MIDEELGLARGCAAVLTVSEAERQRFASGTASSKCPCRRPCGANRNRRRARSNAADRSCSLVPSAPVAERRRSDVLLSRCPAGVAQLPDAAPRRRGGREPFRPTSSRRPTQRVVALRCRRSDSVLRRCAGVRRADALLGRYPPEGHRGSGAAASRSSPRPLVARQLGWQPGNELLVADGAEEFARAVEAVYSDRELWHRIRECALKRVDKDYAPARSARRCEACSIRSAARQARVSATRRQNAYKFSRIRVGKRP